MVDNENLVTEVTENVGTATEETVDQVETPKTYTEEEFNQKFDSAVGKKLARQETRIRKEYDRKYGGLIDVLKAGTGIDDVAEMTNTFKDFYSQKGVEFSSEPNYSARDNEILAKAEADEIINSGYEEVLEEINRLADIGIDNLNARDKAILKTLAEYQKNTETSKELAKLGVSEDVYNSQEFQEFASKFNSKTTIAEIVNYYNQTKPKKEFKTMGSMKNTTVDTGVKDYYSPEEIERLTEEDLANPDVWNAVRRCMTGR